jgi:hypothetical protein
VRAEHFEFALCAALTLRRVAARSAIIAECSRAPVAELRPKVKNHPHFLSTVLRAALALLAEALKGDRAALESILALLKFICDGNPSTVEDRLQQAMPELIALPVAAMPAVAAFLRAALEGPYPLATAGPGYSSAAFTTARDRAGRSLTCAVAAVAAAGAALPPPQRQRAGAPRNPA